MSGQIVDASLVPAPKQRNTEPEKKAVKEGKSATEIWPDNPAKAAQKDVDARWTLKVGGKVRYRPDGTPLPQIATPTFGYKSHISIDRRYGFIRGQAVTSATAADGHQPGVCLIRTTRQPKSGVTPALKAMRNGWRRKCWSAVSIARNPKVNPCRKPVHGPTRENQPSVHGSSMFSPIRKTASVCSSAPSVSNGQKPN